MKAMKKILMVLLIVSVSFTAFGKSDKNWLQKELGFNIGFGGFANTTNLMGLIESGRMATAMNEGKEYDFPGLSDEQKTAFNNMSKAMGQAMIVANILASMEYALKVRITANIFIADIDVTFLPLDGSYNGRFDISLTTSAGIRAPFFLMPYITIGANFLFSIYPEDYKSIETWKASWGAAGRFVFRPGIVGRAGLDIKLGKFAIGAYYQYTVKDFEEFGTFFTSLLNDAYSGDTAKAVGAIMGYQSRFGVSLLFYLF